jgi:hypothetical protein
VTSYYVGGSTDNFSIPIIVLFSAWERNIMKGGCKKLSFSFLWTKTELVSCTCVLTIEKATQDSSSVLDRQEGCKKDFLPGCYPLLARFGPDCKTTFGDSSRCGAAAGRQAAIAGFSPRPAGGRGGLSRQLINFQSSTLIQTVLWSRLSLMQKWR